MDTILPISDWSSSIFWLAESCTLLNCPRSFDKCWFSAFFALSLSSIAVPWPVASDFITEFILLAVNGIFDVCKIILLLFDDDVRPSDPIICAFVDFNNDFGVERLNFLRPSPFSCAIPFTLRLLPWELWFSSKIKALTTSDVFFAWPAFAWHWFFIQWMKRCGSLFNRLNCFNKSSG